MKVVDYEALKRFKERLDATFASKVETDALADDVNGLREDVEDKLTWK